MNQKYFVCYSSSDEVFLYKTSNVIEDHTSFNYSAFRVEIDEIVFKTSDSTPTVFANDYDSTVVSTLEEAVEFILTRIEEDIDSYNHTLNQLRILKVKLENL